MTTKDVLKMNMDMGEMILTTYLSDLSDADLLTRPGPGANPLAWQLGHLINSENTLVNAVCPGSMPALPGGFADVHSRDAAKSDDGSKFLPKQQYLSLFKQQREAAKKALDQLPDANFDKPGPESMRKYAPTVGAVFNLCGNHVTMHVGQFATVRRMLGKPVLI